MNPLVTELGARLDTAAQQARATAQLSHTAQLDVDLAYEVQRASVERRLQRGERLVGLKMGFTSRAKALQMGVSDVICGRLTDRMLIADGGRIAMSRFVHPRVEPEIAFLLARGLDDVQSPLQALAAVAAVAPALEIIDSRYEDFRFSLTDVIADNSSSSAFVLGGWHAPSIDVHNLGMIVSFDGAMESLGSSAAILGHPLRSLVAAARLARERGIPLGPGSIVLAGGATAASALRAPLHVQLEVQALGLVSFSVEK